MPPRDLQRLKAREFQPALNKGPQRTAELHNRKIIKLQPDFKTVILHPQTLLQKQLKIRAHNRRRADSIAVPDI